MLIRLISSVSVPASASPSNTSTSDAAGSSRIHATSAHESTTLIDPGIVVSLLGRALFFQRFRQARAVLNHPPHRAPVRELTHYSLHHQRLSLHVDLELGSGLQIQPFAHCFRDRDLTFGGHRGL